MTISRVPKEVPLHLPPARLYLDDIEDIVRIFTETVSKMPTDISEWMQSRLDSSPIEKQFRVGDKTCDEIEDLPKVTTSTRVFSIEVSRGFLSCRLDVSSNYTLWYASSVLDSWAIYHKLEPVFDARPLRWRRLLHAILDFRLGPILTGLLWVFVFLLSVLTAKLLNRVMPAPFADVIGFIVGVAFLSALILGSLRHTTVVFRHSSEAAALRREKVWKLIFDGLKLVVAWGLGILTAFLTYKYWR